MTGGSRLDITRDVDINSRFNSFLSLAVAIVVYQSSRPTKWLKTRMSRLCRQCRFGRMGVRHLVGQDQSQTTTSPITNKHRETRERERKRETKREKERERPDFFSGDDMTMASRHWSFTAHKNRTLFHRWSCQKIPTRRTGLKTALVFLGPSTLQSVSNYSASCQQQQKTDTL